MCREIDSCRINGGSDLKATHIYKQKRTQIYAIIPNYTYAIINKHTHARTHKNKEKDKKINDMPYACPMEYILPGEYERDRDTSNSN